MANLEACPVALITVNEKQPRIVAGFVALLTISFLVSPHWWLLLFLNLDFLLRGFGWKKWSLLGLLSAIIIKKFQIEGRKEDIGPKQFAAKLGFVLTLLMLIVYPFYLPAALVFGVLLLVFALLESILTICVGCKLYTLLPRKL